MLQTNKPTAPAERSEATAATEFYSDALKFVRRQFPVILIVFLLSLALGGVYVVNAPPSFTAQATMIIDTRKINVFQQQSIIGDTQVDAATVESQVEILKSENIALNVIKELRLTEDPEFVGPGGGLIGGLVSSASDWLGTDGPKSEFELVRRAMETFSNRLSVRRVGLTYIIEISFRSYKPDRASQVANAIAETYVFDQLDAKYKATQRAGSWLQDRIRELREQATAAERAVVNFKTKNNIVNTASGRLMNEQQLGELNTQLVQSRAQTAEAQARLSRIEDIIRAEVPDATVTDTLRNEVVTKLRQNYLDLKAREADWSARYGRNHLATISLRNQMAEIRRSILDELRRIAQTYRSEFEIAKQREAAIQKGLSEVVSDSQATSHAQIALRELESSAQSYRTLYDNFLQRYMESVQQQSFPITEARLITSASPPLKKSHPKSMVIMFLSGVAGVVFGLGAARLRDVADRTFRTASQVEAALQAPCLAVLPSLPVRRADKAARKLAKAGSGDRILAQGSGLFGEVVTAPFSRYTESVRAIKVAVDLSSARGACKVVGITSTLPNEGKSTVAASLAQLIAQGGSKVLLIDADLRNPSLTGRLTPKATAGFIEAVTGEVPMDQARWTDQATNLYFLPTVLKARVANTNEFLASDATRIWFENLRKLYDYIIVDLSPLAPVVDVRTTAHLLDAYVFVVEWGRTKIEAVERSLAEAPNVAQNLVGIVLNKAKISVMSRYDADKGDYYYNKYYRRYNYTG